MGGTAGRGILLLSLSLPPSLQGSLFLSGPSLLSHPSLNTFPIYGRGRKAAPSVKAGGCSQKWGLLLHFCIQTIWRHWRMALSGPVFMCSTSVCLCVYP